MSKTNITLNLYIYNPHGRIYIGNNTADGTVEEHRYNTTSDEDTGYYACDDSKEYGSFKTLHLKLLSEIARCCHEIAPSVNWTYEYVQSAIKMAFQ